MGRPNVRGRGGVGPAFGRSAGGVLIPFRPTTIAQIAALGPPHLGTPSFIVVVDAASNADELDEIASVTFVRSGVTTQQDATDYPGEKSVVVAGSPLANSNGWAPASTSFFDIGDAEPFAVLWHGRFPAAVGGSQRVFSKIGTTGQFLRTISTVGQLTWNVWDGVANQTLTLAADHRASKQTILAGRTATRCRAYTNITSVDVALTATGSLSNIDEFNLAKDAPVEAEHYYLIGWRGAANVGEFDDTDRATFANHFAKFAA